MAVELPAAMFNGSAVPDVLKEIYNVWGSNPSVKEFLEAVEFSLLDTEGFGCYDSDDVETAGLDPKKIQKAGLPEFRVYGFGCDTGDGCFGFWITDNQTDLTKCPVVYYSGSGEFGVLASNVGEYFQLLCTLNQSKWNTAPTEAVGEANLDKEVGENGWSHRYLQMADDDETTDKLLNGRTALMKAAGGHIPKPFRKMDEAKTAQPKFYQYKQCRNLPK
eukprot:TRINITY_DN67613_c9_g5_i1.p2 TRINITY_DN67613_c9_g5~~TRINITY_DN67613_c9_g5_i1.p2  ORF type:complete len:219 (+),score=31.55 TRINITY_DN67613_c9_g5_i1:41-697(+)